MASLRVVCISDSHQQGRDVVIPPGDLLVHAGDLTNCGTLGELEAEISWLRSLPHRHKVIIAGNHDFCFEQQNSEARALCEGLVYLQDEHAVVEGLRIHGSPWSPWFFGWAFGLERGAAIREKWDLIPAELDLLITHGPPHSLGDRAFTGEQVGCEELLLATRRLAPRFHVFGHVHEGYGVFRDGVTTHVNASMVNLQFQPLNPPVVLDIEPRS
jgi:predicted phosphodiesterase